MGIAYFAAAVFPFFVLNEHEDLLLGLWTLYASLTNLLACVALWMARKLGELVFVSVVLFQVAVYIGWSHHLKSQLPLLGFHLVALTGYLMFITYFGRPRSETAV